MIVKGLIEVLLGFDMYKEIYIADTVEYEDEKNGKINGSWYEIENIKEGACVYLEFDNHNHFRVKEKVGNWIEEENDDISGALGIKYKDHRCSRCGYASGRWSPDWHYCPICGAKMKGVSRNDKDDRP
jgi:rubrerythrin